MNRPSQKSWLHALGLQRLIAAALISMASTWAHAAPGAHGPNGEHLDAPAATSAGGGSAAPRLEARSDLFELVASLNGGELSILINKYDTNEPVLNATVEVESGANKAPATFHADLGDYAVDNPALLQALQAAGTHPLVFTVMSGDDADLLEGSLAVTGSSGGHGHSHEGEGAHGHDLERAITLMVVLGVAFGVLVLFIRRAKNKKLAGGAQ